MITAVTGSTRCGTSLVMGMLHAGGVPAYADNFVSYETSKVLGLPRHAEWLVLCEGKAVKLVEPLYLMPLPRRSWRFILMRRDPMEQAKSQIKFIRMLGTPIADDAPTLGVLAASLKADLPKMRRQLGKLGPMIEVAFEDVLADPLGSARRIEAFLGVPLDTDAMAARVIPRSPACAPGLDIEIAASARVAS